MSYELIIGLEIHAQLNTKSKLFCTAATDFGDAPNTNVSPVSLGLPGALPVLNKEAVQLAIMAGLAFDCEIQERSVFARKNYFYADLPKGYQISQFEFPICLGGHVYLEEFDKMIHVTRIHMEEDAGKLNHQGADGIAGATSSIADLNRAGVPLIEIVSEPEIRSAKEARAYMETVHQTLSFIGVCDGDLEKVKSCIQLDGYVNSDENFVDQPKVINGASELMTKIFGNIGIHTRSAVSSNSLPLGAAVEIVSIFEIN